ncbi:hypothetical protein, partial [Barnesiella intestinihominis]|uniref:hypothetical protein n=1 Tax=Barnesiella intestinihominis TaxID=487174 RepID=UPI003AB68834
SGWDDPRMPTVSGIRRGYTPAAIRNFCHTIGITKFNGFTDRFTCRNKMYGEWNDNGRLSQIYENK